MPIHWEIDHTNKIVRVVGEATVTLKDIEVYLDQVVTADAMPYAKLVDGTNVDPKYSDHDLMMLAARMSAYRATLKGGPVAFVVADGPVFEAVGRFINLAPAERAIAIFPTVPEAQAWLDEQAQGSHQRS